MNTYGLLSGQRTISEYSVTVDREVINDRSNARYLIEENIADPTFLDLGMEMDSFIDKAATLSDESSFTLLCKWACTQQGDDLKQVFGGAEFVGRLGTFKRIAGALYQPQKEAWKMVAVKLGGIIILGRDKISDRTKISIYSPCKFKQYMTADRPGGSADLTSPVDNRSSFERVVRSDVTFCMRTLKLCSMVQVDALCGEEAVVLKAVVETGNGLACKVDQVVASELSGVKRVVTGFKNNNHDIQGYYVEKVVSRRVSEMKQTLNGAELKGYAMLFDVLSQVKAVLQGATACEIKLNPHSIDVNVTPISMEDAKKRNYRVTPEFATRFNLDV